MTLNEFLNPWKYNMIKVVNMVEQMKLENKKDYSCFMDIMNDKQKQLSDKLNTYFRIFTTIIIIVDSIFECGIVGLMFYLNNDKPALKILLTILVVSLFYLNTRTYFIIYKITHNELTEKYLKNKEYHKSIEISKDMNNFYNTIFNDFDMLLKDIHFTKINIFSFGKYEKLYNRYHKIHNNKRITYDIAFKTFRNMNISLYDELTKKFNLSSSIFNSNNVDELVNYINKRFDKSFIESIFNNITPSNEKSINILFILTLIVFMYDFEYKQEEVGNGKMNLSTSYWLEEKPIKIGIQIIMFEIFQYGFDKLGNTFMSDEMREIYNLEFDFS